MTTACTLWKDLDSADSFANTVVVKVEAVCVKSSP